MISPRHGIPDDRPLEEGDFLNVDVTARRVTNRASRCFSFIVLDSSTGQSQMIRNMFDSCDAVTILRD